MYETSQEAKERQNGDITHCLLKSEGCPTEISDAFITEASPKDISGKPVKWVFARHACVRATYKNPEDAIHVKAPLDQAFWIILIATFLVYCRISVSP
jgi:hypothetical protein